jgi:HK97 family phage portal protein
MIVDRILARLGFERRSSLENPQVPLSYPAEWLLDIFNGGRTDSGIRVSEMTALQVGTVYACVNLISNGFSSLPLHVYEKVVSDHRVAKRVAYSHALYDLLHSEPNAEMTSTALLKVLMIHALLWGNAYAEIERDPNTNQIVGLWPRNPARTRAIRTLKPLLLEGDTLPPGTLLYETSDSLMGGSDLSSGTENPENRTAKRRLILAEDMIHVPGLSLDGRVGQSTVWLARQIIGLSLATEKYGAKFFGNGARPAGVLEIPSAMEDKAIENLRRSWAEGHGGENQFKVAVLEQGVKFTKIAATPEEGQMLATRQHQREDVCAIFSVPLHMVAAQEKGGGKSNVEQNSIEFVLYCLQPWLTNFEQEFNRRLFPKVGRSAGKYFAHFDTRRLLYPDSESRAKFYSAGKNWGFLSTNDVRELEDMNPVEDGTGDQYWAPVNCQPASMPLTGGPGMKAHLDLKAQYPGVKLPAPDEEEAA